MPLLVKDPSFYGAMCERCNERFLFPEEDEYVHDIDLHHMEVEGWAVFIGPDNTVEYKNYTENTFYCPKHNPVNKKAKKAHGKNRTKGGK